MEAKVEKRETLEDQAATAAAPAIPNDIHIHPAQGAQGEDGGVTGSPGMGGRRDPDPEGAAGEVTEEVDLKHVIYHVHETPPVYMWPVYGLQQAFMCVSGTLSVPFLISGYICADHLPLVRAQLLCVTFFICGVATLLQCIVGIRLPIIQGASYAFLPPILTMMQLSRWQCPADYKDPLEDGEEEPWKIRIREIQGNLLLASLTQVILGSTGMVGVLLRFIGPVTVAPAIALIGMGFTTAVTDFADTHWGVAGFTAAMMLVFILWLGRVPVPVPSYSRDRGCHVSRFPVFLVLSVLFAVGCGWVLCAILTVSDALPSNSTEKAYKARTDINLDVVSDAPWFDCPYPFMFGTPTVSVAGFFGMLMAVLSSVLESMGDYFACARVSGAPPPPPHAINRGIVIDGLSSVLSGLVGAGHSTTPYTGNIAAIAVTRVASRRVFQVAGVILLLLGAFSKVGAVMTLIPDPVIGGLNGVLLGSLIAVGISTLRCVDMESPRNVTIIGITFMLGLALPQWVYAEPGRIDTGSDTADQILKILMGTPMFVGGLLGAILDNIAPGTPEERGISTWQENMHAKATPSSEENREDVEEVEDLVSLTYDLPYVSDALRRIRCCAYVPFLPSFDGFFSLCRSPETKQEPADLPSANGKINAYDHKAFDNETFEKDAQP